MINNNKDFLVLVKWRDMQFINVISAVCYGMLRKIDRFVTEDIVFELVDSDNEKLKCFFFFLRKSMLTRFTFLYDITAVDLLEGSYRFFLYYNFLSGCYNIRIFVKIFLCWGKTFPYTNGMFSLTWLYKSANWLEREVWDMFGIFFYDHPDLRRILTDYGFVGFPLRKDYPVVGFYEVKYDDFKKIIVYNKIKLSQEYRVFNFVNPWY